MAFSSSAVKKEDHLDPIILSHSGSSSRAFDIGLQQKDIATNKSSLPTASKHIYMNEGANASVFATHDFLSLYGGTPRYVDQHGSSAPITTKDLLQPLELRTHRVQGTSNSQEHKHGGNLQWGNFRGDCTDAAMQARHSPIGLDYAQKERMENFGYWSNVQVKFGFADFPNQQPANKQRLQEQNENVKRSVRLSSDDDEDDEEENIKDNNNTNNNKNIRNEGSSKKNDVKIITPRSKHSATEQRRRSKINDRFQMLRRLVPHSEQKRDKASFLLEVVHYVKGLQEKVKKMESVNSEKQHQDIAVKRKYVHLDEHRSKEKNVEEEEKKKKKKKGPDVIGGVINISTVYSQGLLHTLGGALQSCGLDLSKANISVQIDIGNQKSSSIKKPSPQSSAVQSQEREDDDDDDDDVDVDDDDDEDVDVDDDGDDDKEHKVHSSSNKKLKGCV